MVIDYLSKLKGLLDEFMKSYKSLVNLEGLLYNQLIINKQLVDVFTAYEEGLFNRLEEEQAVLQFSYEQLLKFFNADITDRVVYFKLMDYSLILPSRVNVPLDKNIELLINNLYKLIDDS